MGVVLFKDSCEDGERERWRLACVVVGLMRAIFPLVVVGGPKGNSELMRIIRQ